MKCYYVLLLVVVAFVGIIIIPGARCWFGLPHENLLLGGIRKEEETSSKSPFPDPLTFGNVTSSRDEDHFKGDLTIRNGVVRGLSTFWHSYRLVTPFDLSLFFSPPPPLLLLLVAGFDYLEIIGDYELLNGYINLPAMDFAHTFSGKGLLHLSVAGLTFSTVLQTDAETGAAYFDSELTQVSIKGGTYFAENFTQDGELFDGWTEVSEDLPGGLLSFTWEEAVREWMVDELNKEIEGLTLEDIIKRILDSPPAWKT